MGKRGASRQGSWLCRITIRDRKTGEVRDCARPGYRKGICRAHYEGRDPQLDPRVTRDGACSVPGCGRDIEARGLCQTHYQRKRKGVADPTRPIQTHRKMPGGGVKWSRDSVYLPREVVAYIEDHARSRSMSVYALKTEIYLAWYKERMDLAGTPEIFEGVADRSRQERLLELLERHYYGITMLAIYEAMEDDYPSLLTSNSAAQRKFYRDIAALGVKGREVGGVIVYSHPKHAHRVREEDDE